MTSLQELRLSSEVKAEASSTDVLSLHKYSLRGLENIQTVQVGGYFERETVKEREREWKRERE